MTEISNGDTKSQVLINEVKAMLWHVAEALLVAVIIGVITMYGVSQSQKSEIQGLRDQITQMQISINNIQSALIGKGLQGEPGEQGRPGKTGKEGKNFWGK